MREEKLPSGFRVRVLEEQEWKAWDIFVSRSPQGTLFHTTVWLLNNGGRFKIFGCFFRDVLIGGMVLELTGTRRAGHADQTQYLGMVLPPKVGKYLTVLSYHQNICDSLALYVKRNFDSIECQMSPEVLDVQPFIWAGYSAWVDYTYRIDLADLDRAWGNMGEKRRNDIRRATGMGVVVDSTATIEEVLLLVEKTYERKSIPYRFQDRAIERDRVLRSHGQSRCFVARDKAGRAIASVYIVWDGRTAYYLLGGSDSETRGRGASALAIWEAIRFSRKTLRVQKFDLLPGNFRSHERFFRDFGGELTPRYSVQWERKGLRRDLRRAWARFKRMSER